MIHQQISHFRLIRELCAPGRSGEFLASDTSSGRVVSLLVLPPVWVKNEGDFLRFAEEMQAVATLDHPNIAQVYDVGRDAGHHFVARETVAGVTLGAVIRGGGYDLRPVFGILRQVAEGLAVAHKAGILHLDLTPHRIKVPRDGAAKISGFGLTKLLRQSMRDRTDDEESAADLRRPLKTQNSCTGGGYSQISLPRPSRC